MTNSYEVNAQSSDLESASYNIAIGTVFTTIGAIINKEKDGKVINVIKKRWRQGTLGGYLNFESKLFFQIVFGKHA